MTSPAAHPASSVRLLLSRAVDYAGLFPPASLDMAAAVAEYAEHGLGPHAWALGRFVLPSARLEEFERDAAPLLPQESARSWALSALVSTDVEEDLGRIGQFNDRHRDVRQGAVHVDTVELKTHTPRDVAHAAELLDRNFVSYMEVPVAEDPAEMIAAIAETHGRAKIRTGGVTADAFPTSAQVVRFIARCVAHDVSFKATAGLHHPWRADYRLTYASDAPVGTMFGFLNVLLATAALHAGLGDRDAIALLEEREPTAVEFDEDRVLWRNHVIALDALGRARDSMAAFGSCSFREPVADLRAMSLL
jgi:hypothetical protein